MARRCIDTHRTFMGWDVFFERSPHGINWIARKERPDGGHKLRSYTLAGIREAIRQNEKERRP